MIIMSCVCVTNDPLLPGRRRPTAARPKCCSLQPADDDSGGAHVALRYASRRPRLRPRPGLYDTHAAAAATRLTVDVTRVLILYGNLHVS